jgi:malonate transporter MadL subunit
MTIFGVALLAVCTILGNLLGELLGHALGVKANVGGVGIAMLMLIGLRIWLAKRGWLDSGVIGGIGFWGSLYIPIVVAMAANQNVVAAVRGGPAVVLAAVLATGVCFVGVAWLGRIGGRGETMDEIEAREALEQAQEGRTL